MSVYINLTQNYNSYQTKKAIAYKFRTLPLRTMTLKLNIQFKQVILLPILFLSIKGFSQAPNISYPSVNVMAS